MEYFISCFHCLEFTYPSAFGELGRCCGDCFFNLIKDLLDISDDMVDVPWCPGMLEVLNGVEESQV